MIKIRPMSPQGDPAASFVYSAWVRSYMAAATGGDDSDPPTELAHYLVRANPERAQVVLVAYVRDLIEVHGATIYVAHAEDDPALFLGFICVSDEATVHYVYVKKRVRRRGVATALLAHVESEHGLMMQRTTTITWPWTLDWATQRLGIDYCPVLGDPYASKQKAPAASADRGRDHAASAAADADG